MKKPIITIESTTTRILNKTLELKKDFQLLSNQISRNQLLSDGAKVLYIYLNSHNENFNLTAKSIAKYLKKDERTIQRHIKELKRAGFLIIERKENSNAYKYKLLDEPNNNDYKVQEMIKENQIKDLISIAEDVFSDKTITEQTKQEVIKAIQKIAKYDWKRKANE